MGMHITHDVYEGKSGPGSTTITQGSASSIHLSEEMMTHNTEFLDFIFCPPWSGTIQLYCSYFALTNNV